MTHPEWMSKKVPKYFSFTPLFSYHKYALYYSFVALKALSQLFDSFRLHLKSFQASEQIFKL